MGLILFFTLGTVASVPFVVDGNLRLILGVPAGFLLWNGFEKFRRGRHLQDQQVQYQAILSYLLSQISIGRSLEQALLSSHSAMAATYPPRHPLNRVLFQVRQQLNANRTASQALQILIGALDCPQAAIGLGMLTRIPLSGDSLLVFLRQAHQSLGDLLEIRRDIAAQNAKTSAEAGVLAVMPFVVTLFLGQSGNYLMTVQAHPVGRLVMGAAFLLSVTALSIIPGVLQSNHSMKSGGKQEQRTKRPPKAMVLASVKLRQIKTALSGRSQRQRVQEALMRIHGETSVSSDLHDVEAVRYALAGLFLGVLLSVGLMTPFALPVPPAVLVLLHDQVLIRRARQDEVHLLSTFPFFLQTCVSLLEAGLTVHHVLTLVSQAFAQPRDGNSLDPMEREAARLNQKLRAGIPSELALDQMAGQSTTSELRAAYQLLGRYGRLGGQELLQQLMAQTRACWLYYRNASRSQLDEQSMRMMLPMMMDLIVVMIVSITPAILMMIAG